MFLTEIVAIIAQLVFLEGVLSIDNAAVLGAMVSTLPQHERVPWPPQLRSLGQRADVLLGGQQMAALRVGVLGAYIGRGLMLVLASFIIRNPWLRLLAAAYLFKVAISHLARDIQAAEAGVDRVSTTAGRGFWKVVLMVELTDLAFSVDSVLVAVAISRSFWVVMTGVAVGIIVMRFAAQAFTVLIQREPVLVPTAYVLVLIISIELVAGDLTALAGHRLDIDAVSRFLVSLGLVVLALAYAHNPRMQRLLNPALRGAGRAMAAIDAVLDVLLTPFRLMLEGLAIMARALVWGSSEA